MTVVLLSSNFCLRFYLFIFRERGREGEREGEKHQCVVASCAPPTGEQACTTDDCPDWESNQWPFASQSGSQSTEPYQPGQNSLTLTERISHFYPHLRIFYFNAFRERGRERKKINVRERSINLLPSICTWTRDERLDWGSYASGLGVARDRTWTRDRIHNPGICLTGNQTHNLLVTGQCSNQLSHTSKGQKNNYKRSLSFRHTCKLSWRWHMNIIIQQNLLCWF